ncbi:MAG: DNA-3-methyladenine glycosylase 2 family protein [Saprospiraceae bacterium]|jgi:DNA-3-methyladenine glycosylase II|nr:DNA-3-methyladenine glycosylase 2 family protein [Saprospiraceae bacterium]
MIEAAKIHLSKDKKFKPLIEDIQIEWPVINDDVYFYLIRSIVYQQLSGKAAGTIFARFLELFSEGYPYPEPLLGFDIVDLRAVGLSRQKASYILNVAAFFQTHQLENNDWQAMEDDEIIQFLTQIKGVGKWTVQMILMTSLNRSDVFPVDDLGIQKSVQKLYAFEDKGRSLKKKMLALSQPWRPYRTIASFYLWRFQDIPA